MTNPATSSASVLARLRSLMPRCGLDETTACGIAERQANLLLRLHGLTDGPVPLAVLAQLPRTELAVVAELPTSGMSYWTGQTWRLEANQDDCAERQRFTFAHEFKHVIDHPGRDLFYASHRTRERVADHFAASLLMPRRWITRAWCSGEQDIARLADLFAVSTEAMTRRLLALGLLEQRPIRPLFCTRGTNYLRPGRSVVIDGGIPAGGPS